MGQTKTDLGHIYKSHKKKSPTIRKIEEFAKNAGVQYPELGSDFFNLLFQSRPELRDDIQAGTYNEIARAVANSEKFQALRKHTVNSAHWASLASSLLLNEIAKSLQLEDEPPPVEEPPPPTQPSDDEPNDGDKEEGEGDGAKEAEEDKEDDEDGDEGESGSNESDNPDDSETDDSESDDGESSSDNEDDDDESSEEDDGESESDGENESDSPDDSDEDNDKEDWKGKSRGKDNQDESDDAEAGSRDDDGDSENEDDESEDEGADEEERGKFEEEEPEPIDPSDKPVEARIQKAVDDAAEKLESFLDGLQAGKGDRLVSGEQSAELADQLAAISQNRRLQDIVQKIGRMKLNMKHLAALDTANPEQVISFTFGNSIQHVLPQDIAGLMGDKEEFTRFATKHSNRELLQRKYKSTTHTGKGPMVVCLDQSGSMNTGRTSRLEWATILTSALYMQCVREKRLFAVIHFSSHAVAHLPKGIGVDAKFFN